MVSKGKTIQHYLKNYKKVTFMKISKNTLLIILVLMPMVGCSLQAMKKEDKQDLLGKLIQQNSSSSELDVKIQKWLKNNAELVKKITDSREITDPKKHYTQTKEELEKQGIVNLSKYNYALKSPDEKYLIRFAGPSYHRENINAQLGRAWETPVTKEDYEKFVSQYGDDFYQNISRFTNWLNYKKAIKENSLDQLVTGNMYLFKNESAPESKKISDKNTVIVDSIIKGVPLNDPYALKNLDSTKLSQLYSVIKQVGLSEAGDGANVLMTPEAQQKFAY